MPTPIERDREDLVTLSKGTGRMAAGPTILTGLRNQDSLIMPSTGPWLPSAAIITCCSVAKEQGITLSWGEVIRFSLARERTPRYYPGCER